MAATLHDVARLSGLSIKTVSNVINDNYPHIRPATRRKVLDAIAELGYQPNLYARGLRSGRTGAIGLALPELSLSYFGELADAVIIAAEKRGLVVLIERTGGDRAREIDVLSSQRRRMTDGLIFSPLGLQYSDREQLEVDFPLVLLGERRFDGPKDQISMENVDGARAATRHLIASGRRRIAIIGSRPEASGAGGLRLQGHQEALAEAGIGYDPSIVVQTSFWHRANGAVAMRELLSRGVEFDAVFAFSDTLALGAMRVLQESGRRVPQDVAVMGFDNLDETRYSLPTLSTVDPGRDEIAETAVTVLMQRIAGEEVSGPLEIRSKFSIVERESTARSA